MGWRYLIFTLGGLTLVMWFVRFFVFRFHESPRYLIGRGRDKEAVEIAHKIAEFNGRADRCTLTVEDLQGTRGEKYAQGSPALPVRAELADAEGRRGLLSSSSHLSGSHIKALFSTKKMAWSTSLLILIWGTIGLASTLYNSFLPYILSSLEPDVLGSRSEFKMLADETSIDPRTSGELCIERAMSR